MLKVWPVIYHRAVKVIAVALAVSTACLALACSAPRREADPGPEIVTTHVDTPDCETAPQQALQSTRIEITDGRTRLALRVEVAQTARERSQGLMCRSTVAPGTGMLFMMEAPSNGGFWMHNTYVDLDVLYIGAGGQVRALRTMSPCPRREGEETPSWQARCVEEAQNYVSGQAYSFALEIPAGWLSRQGLDRDPTRLTVTGLPSK